MTGDAAQTEPAPKSASPPPPPPCSSLPQLECLAQSPAGERAAPLQCAPSGGGSFGARRATRSSLVGSCGAPPQPELAPLSPDAAPFFPSAGRSKSMRWDEISLTDDEDERSPSPYLEAARRALAQPTSVGAPPIVDSASLHAARTGEIQASPGGANRRARVSVDRTAGATSTDGADATSPVRRFKVQARLAVVVRSTPTSPTGPLQFFASWRETMLFCLLTRLVGKMGALVASSLGACFWDAKHCT